MYSISRTAFRSWKCSDTAAFRERLVEHQMRRRVARWLPFALDDPSIQIDNDHVLRRHAVIRHTGGLDDGQAALAVDAGEIAPCAYCRRNA